MPLHNSAERLARTMCDYEKGKLDEAQTMILLSSDLSGLIAELKILGFKITASIEIELVK